MEPTATQKQGTNTFSVQVESHCIGCSTCVQVCGAVFEMGSGSMDQQKSFVKKDAPLASEEANVDTAVQMCPVTAIVKTSE